MTAAFRRAILIEGREREVVAELEDDFHRFGVTLRHDGKTVLAVEGRAGRYPWATCAEAPTALAALAGVALAADPTALFRHADPRRHCTHLFELAALALAQAARGPGARRYEAEVTDPVEGVREARLARDGELVLEWRLQGDAITAPPAYAGRKASSFGSRILAEFEPELAEPLLILRRIVQTSTGRGVDLDAIPGAAALGSPPACYSLQPANLARALRIKGSARDWPDHDALLG